MGGAWRRGEDQEAPGGAGPPVLHSGSCHSTSSPGTFLLFNVYQFCGSKMGSLGLSLLIRLCLLPCSWSACFPFCETPCIFDHFFYLKQLLVFFLMI